MGGTKYCKYKANVKSNTIGSNVVSNPATNILSNICRFTLCVIYYCSFNTNSIFAILSICQNPILSMERRKKVVEQLCPLLYVSMQMIKCMHRSLFCIQQKSESCPPAQQSNRPCKYSESRGTFFFHSRDFQVSM